jgi:hypothetical protein
VFAGNSGIRINDFAFPANRRQTMILSLRSIGNPKIESSAVRTRDRMTILDFFAARRRPRILRRAEERPPMAIGVPICYPEAC